MGAYPLAQIPSGNYFFRVVIRDDKDPAENWQIAFDAYSDPVTGERFFGLREFNVE